MTDQDRLAEIRQRRAAIEPPPWHYDIEGGVWTDETGVLIASSYDETDGRFIAHAPTDIDHLLQAVEELGGEVERLRGLLRRLEWRGCVEHFECPACGQRENKGGHNPDCWLAAAIRST